MFSPKLVAILALQIVPMTIWCPLIGANFVTLTSTSSDDPSAAEQTRAFALLFSSLQCISETDEDDGTKEILEINRNFNPEEHLSEYENPDEVELLVQHVNEIQGNSELITEPFGFSPDSIGEMNLILDALYPNTENWPLFYNTSVWLIGRVNGVRLYFMLSVIISERFTHSVVAPTSIDVFPQMFINKTDIAKVVAGLTVEEFEHELHPVFYWMTDPWLNEFHWNWHTDNPFFWNETRYPVRDRKGELFFYMHRQLIARYNAERVSNGLPYLTSLVLEPDFVIPEPYYPDIVNVDYVMYPTRVEGTTMGDLDGGGSLSDLRIWFERLTDGINKTFLVRPDGSHESLMFDNASTILGAAVGASTPSTNLEFYGDFHNNLHKFLAQLDMPEGPGPSPGVVSSTSTALRDRVFFRLHKKVDDLYTHLKKIRGPYSKRELDFPGIKISKFEIIQKGAVHVPPLPHILTTFFNWVTFDISTAARQCRGVGETAEFAQVKTLNYEPFIYSITVHWSGIKKAHGMVRIFLLPENGHNGRKLGPEEINQNAIELDIFPVVLSPGETKTILRSSIDSSITWKRPLPGIKPLFNLSPSSPDGEGLLDDDKKRACGYPNNLLIPKGTKEGLKFKLFVMISEERKEEVELPHWPYCGMLNNLKYPDLRAMGFPFDRVGTSFLRSHDGNGFVNGNVFETGVKIRHRGDDI